MRRTEPPSMATWLLEHGRPGGGDDALSGDLLEEFNSGHRSTNWYWRQVISACGLEWLESVRVRASLFVFCLLWSMPAPAWKIFGDRIEHAQALEQLWQLAGALWVIPAFIFWAGVQSSYLWAGILTYILVSKFLGNSFRGETAILACLRAPLVFLPIIGVTFVLMNLYSYPGLIDARLAPTPLGQIADLRMPADVLRIPYFIALVCALWVLALRNQPQRVELSRAPEIDSSDQEAPSSAASGADHSGVARVVSFLTVAGLINAMIAALLVCRLPSSHEPSMTGLFVRALIYVALSALAGTAGAWLYWRRASISADARLPFSFKWFALTCAAAWVWLPAFVLLAGGGSPFAALVAAIGAAVLAAGLRPDLTEQVGSLPSQPEEHDLFAATLRTPAREFSGYVIAACVYAGLYAIYDRDIFAACTLLAVSAFLFTWNVKIAPARTLSDHVAQNRAALRLVRTALPAVLLTLWALLNGVAHHAGGGEGDKALARGESNTTTAKTDRARNRADLGFDFDGYESIILWPALPKKEILAPVAPPPRDVRLTQPRVIRFTGSYWYFQPPSTRPGPHAHFAHGSPLAVDIHSTTFIPLTMEAHQTLAYPERIACCAAIQVAIENRDNRAGALSLAMVVTDRTARGRPSLYLGQQPIVSSEPDHFTVKSSSVNETLRFPVPAYSQLRRFDEITLVVISDPMRIDMGARIAIEKFELEPR
jgi:hypothetical protein